MSEANTYTVLGAARSGLAAARLLRAEGARVFVSDSRPAEAAAEAIELLGTIDVPFEFGGHSDRVLEAETIVISPGVPDTIPIVVRAKEMGIRIVSEIEIAAARCAAPIVAITGTNGKTTTTELTGYIFRRAGRRTFVAGNVGIAFSDIVAQADADSVVVLEVSSFQLEHISSFHPRVAAILNITPDHLDRYPSFEAYVEAKFRITMKQGGDDVLIYNAENAPLADTPNRTAARPLAFALGSRVAAGAFVHDGALMLKMDPDGGAVRVLPVDEIRIRGPHNLANAMAAALAASSMGLCIEDIAAGLREFAGVPHRLEPIAEIDGVRWINDSKATNVDSVWYALSSFPGNVILIAGGTSKRSSYDSIIPLVDERVKAAVLVGDAADEIAAAFAGHTDVHRADYSMAKAVDTARELALPGDIVLLSPACASFDMFNNYEHRGDVFRELVRALETERNGEIAS